MGGRTKAQGESIPLIPSNPKEHSIPECSFELICYLPSSSAYCCFSRMTVEHLPSPFRYDAVISISTARSNSVENSCV